MVGSARKTISYDPTGSAGVPPAFVCASELSQSDFIATVFAGSAVFGTNPSCKLFRHLDSKSVGAPAVGAPASCGRFAGILPAPTRSLLLPVPTPCACVRQ